MDRKFGALLVDIQASLLVQDFTVHTQAEVLICGNTCCVHDKHDKCIVSSSNVFTDSTIYRKMMISFSDNTLPISLLLSKALLIAKVISESAFNIKSAFDTKSAFRYHFWKQKCKVGAFGLFQGCPVVFLSTIIQPETLPFQAALESCRELNVRCTA